jgi:hypothetical protein
MTLLAHKMCELYKHGVSLDEIAAETQNTRQYVIYVLMGCSVMGAL